MEELRKQNTSEIGDFKILSTPPVLVGSEKLTCIYLRYYPVALILEISCSKGKSFHHKTIELTDFEYNSNIKEAAAKLMADEPFFNEQNKPVLISCLEKLKKCMTPVYARQYKAKKYVKTHSLPVLDADITQDGLRFATAGYDKTCKIWNTQTGKELCSLSGHFDVVCSCSFNKAGNQLLTGSYDGTLRLWNIPTVEESGPAGDVPRNRCLQTLQGSSGEVQTCEYSSNFLLTAAGYTDNAAYVYDLSTGEKLHTLVGHESDVNNVKFNLADSVLLTGSFDGKLGLWDLRSGELIKFLVGHEKDVTKCEFDFAGDKICSCSLDKLVQLWDFRQLQKPMATFDQNTDEVWDVAFNSRGSALASGAKDGKLLIWDVRECILVAEKTAHSGGINQVTFNPPGSLVLTCGDSSCRLWNPNNAELSQTLEGHGQDQVVRGLFNYHSDKLVTVSNNYAQTWDLE